MQRSVMAEGGKDAVTDVQVLEHFGDRYTLVELTLHTGRTHQIRVHLSHIDTPSPAISCTAGKILIFSGRRFTPAI